MFHVSPTGFREMVRCAYLLIRQLQSALKDNCNVLSLVSVMFHCLKLANSWSTILQYILQT